LSAAINNLEKQIELKVKPIMLDPSLLCATAFWKDFRPFGNTWRNFRIPFSIRLMNEREFTDFYADYLPKLKIMDFQEMLNLTSNFESFNWKENINRLPELLRDNYSSLRSNLAESKLSESIQNSLLDEFIFLATQSSIASRLKKSFKMFEKLKALPLINLEKIAPEEWKGAVKGVKTAVSAVRWLALIGGFNLWLGPGAQIVGGAVTGIRIFLIDP
jgi:hypothetical protein